MNGTLSKTEKLILFSKQWIESIKLKQLMQNFENKIIINSTMNTYTTEELENAFEFYDAKQMYKCRNHDDHIKSVRHQAWVNNSNLVKSSIEEYHYYLRNYGSVLTFDHAGNSGISTNPAPKILLRVPTQEDDEDEDEEEECRARQKKSESNPEMWKILAMQESARLQEREEQERLIRVREERKEQERLRVPESERRRLREEREEQLRQYMKEREEEMEEYKAWREENKFKPNPEMWKILAMQESARLQERERLIDEEEERQRREDDERLRDEEDDEKEEEEDEDDEEEDIPLRNMTDLQIEKYVERIGQYPRDECKEWTMVYNGGDIIRYSYCKFIQWHIEDQTVSNITITRATFDEITFTNYVFDNVTFDECVFKDVILNNTTFKNSKFIECDFDSSLVLDKSCEVVNYIDDDDHIHITYY